MSERLKNLNLSKKIDKESYFQKLEVLQYEMLNAQQFLLKNKIGLILVFEGMDAAGKGGAIKRITERIDPRGYIVHPISAPQPHELRYNYMHRFWRKLPQHGQIGIFDRSWYGRVLVERVEGFATKKEWSRAYEEINNFEKMLTDGNYIIVKYWLHVSKEEQLQRFLDRENDPYKAWKLTDEDWRNREKWERYEVAAEEMFDKTDKDNAAWILVPGNNKKYARIHVLEETLRQIEYHLEERGLKLTDALGNEPDGEVMIEEKEKQKKRKKKKNKKTK
ncbi:UDP-galactose-lipid carrier transferase [Lysinibacillus alkalisoli]|uniref:UDP-galactose-lipid carrier transferase n=1 Tax=Lysinibacillus alkalisoli TaxID=1911548 RepID=A0A917LJK5_9BACI|nr:polyphosphate kinase [Lysinibacillus alkalisoli]GGG32099.1 UDP-galactose-lipid carrier transferase [Lysinibacillus alkalisoli]